MEVIIIDIYKIIHMRTCGLSHQIMGPTTVQMAKKWLHEENSQITVGGPLF